ncbi:elongation factor Tu GTP binding domain containing protein, putative [Babesia bigemina]|uniref:Elongation factor Tu GTP binding domain containing protein, putative n=1 Tax=Babesia bigemina TaxID=5866 RepID=A0A061D313_BABBI|nr:elongation factor Tu GTP binding domain containing protein, putative [Babesia bigemina]CDR95156.1 elongation factor Tu GTP binding domain containing protein, putative [Babesia bigemina]|eukprot:XP_012767342.1 elongation factor Tu GTP binding domain containing protein, putative [Babesia bigemina]
MFISAHARYLDFGGFGRDLLLISVLFATVTPAVSGIRHQACGHDSFWTPSSLGRCGFQRQLCTKDAYIPPPAYRNFVDQGWRGTTWEYGASADKEVRIHGLRSTPDGAAFGNVSFSAGPKFPSSQAYQAPIGQYSYSGYYVNEYDSGVRPHANRYAYRSFNDGTQGGYSYANMRNHAYGHPPFPGNSYQTQVSYDRAVGYGAYHSYPGYDRHRGPATRYGMQKWHSSSGFPNKRPYHPGMARFSPAADGRHAPFEATRDTRARGGVYGSENVREFSADDEKEQYGESGLTNREYFCSFRVYNQLTWMNDFTPHEEWPGVSKLKHGEVFNVMIRHWMTPVRAVALSLDKMAECCLVADGIPPELSTPTVKTHFKADKIVQVKLKWPQEFDDKGRPLVVMHFPNGDPPASYSAGDLAWSIPLMINGNQAIMKLEDSNHVALMYLCELGAPLIDNKRYGFADFLGKGERIQLQITHTPHHPDHITYRACVPWASPKRLEWARKFPEIKEMLAPCEYNRNFLNVIARSPAYRNMSFGNPEMPPSDYKPEPHGSNQKDIYSFLPTAEKPLSISEFTKSIGGKLKDVLRYLLLQTKSPVDPNTPIPVNLAKTIYNFVSGRTEFNDIDTYARAYEIDQLKEKSIVVSLERPPVVVLMGHINHGKTALFDMLTGTCNVEKEPGQITQMVRTHSLTGERAMTLIDTPGHEVFDAMRRCGATIADIALVVVDSTEGLMKQTRESINLCKQLGIPFIVAATKCDLPNARNRAEELALQLSEEGVVIEGLGGDIQFLQVSAKEDTDSAKQSIVDAIMLQAAASDDHVVTESPGTIGRGYILDSGKGNRTPPFCLAIVKQGKIAKDSYFVSGKTIAKIKGLKTHAGKRVTSAVPSQAILVEGFEDGILPTPGDSFVVYTDEESARVLTDDKIDTEREQVAATELQRIIYEGIDALAGRATEDTTVKRVPALVKGATQGLVDALKHALSALNVQGMMSTAVYEIVEATAGPIYQSDITSAYGANAVILALDSPLRVDAKSDAKKHNVTVVSSEVIYDLMEKARELLAQRLGDRLLTTPYGSARVLKVFDAAKVRLPSTEPYTALQNAKAAGCVVLKGRIPKNSAIRVLRNNRPVYAGKIASLRHTTDSTDEAVEAQSCGMTFEGWNDVQVNDVVEAYEP